MTTNTNVAAEELDKLNENLARVEELSRRFMRVMTHKKLTDPGIQGPNQELFAKATTAYWAEMMQDPAKIFEHQMQYWADSVKHFVATQHALTQGETLDEDDITDRRFANPMWSENPYFAYVKKQYLINANAIKQAVSDIDDMSPLEKTRLEHFANQITDMMAPTNFLATNPDALMKAVETEGESLVKGLENLVADLEANNGELVVKLADEHAFRLGDNIATAKGEVVYRNRMMELIQYSPTTDEVHETPLIIFPPWINKFYIMDLKEQNSLIRWIVDQGYTLFVVSWINPDHDYADVGLEEYIQEGYLTAIEEAKAICKVKSLNVIGYCIAGTTLSIVLALLKARKDKSIKSATFFTALTDFSDQGEFTPFLTNDFIDGIEREIDKNGVLESWIMARTFSYLRANDLVYGPAIKSYMMGETPPAFDLLYWNGDGSNLPGKMAKQYLRGLCQDNKLAKGEFEILGEKLTLQNVTVPLMSIACETDHIAAWKDVYRGVQLMGSKDKTFVLSESGHIAGIVNPPSKKKYGHYMNDDLSGDAKAWHEGAVRHDGSWWPMWEKWLKPRSGKMITAREPGDSDHPSLAPAPGTYVTKKSKV